MSHRIGECSACGAVFKLPASFAHDQARCTKCGGVVNIAPAGAGEAPPVPAKRVVKRPEASAPKPKPEPVAAAAAVPQPAPKKERSGPSMKEKILARKQAEAAPKPAPTAKAAAPVRKAASAKQTAAAPKKAAAPAKTSARRTATAAAPAAKANSTRAGGSGRSSSRRSGSGGRSRSSSRKAGTAASEEGVIDDSGVAYRDRVKAQRKKGSLLAGIVAIVLLGAVGGGVWLFMNKDAAKEAGDGTVNTAGLGTDVDGGVALVAPTDEEGGSEDTNAPEDDEPTGAEPDAGATEVDEAGAETDKPAAKPPKDPKAPRGPELVDLTIIEDFEKLPETSDERWTEIRQDVADGFDMDAGASAGRARGRLKEAGKAAFPAILNAFKNTDVTTEAGHRQGDTIQKTLEQICNGNNLGWKYNDDFEKHYFNKQVIAGWCTLWTSAKDDEAKWLKLSKQDAPEESAGGDAPADESGFGEDDFDFDD